MELVMAVIIEEVTVAMMVSVAVVMFIMVQSERVIVDAEVVMAAVDMVDLNMQILLLELLIVSEVEVFLAVMVV